VTVKLRGAAAVHPSSHGDELDRPWLSLLSALDGDGGLTHLAYLSPIS
jgi:hypothetical protein